MVEVGHSAHTFAQLRREGNRQRLTGVTADALLAPRLVLRGVMSYGVVSCGVVNRVMSGMMAHGVMVVAGGEGRSSERADQQGSDNELLHSPRS
jgi:hypothetical protein